MINLPGIHYFPTSDNDEEIDNVYRTIDEMFNAGKFSEVEDLLDNVVVHKVSITLGLGYLTITLMPLGRTNDARQRLVKRLRDHLTNVETPERIEALLRGLE